MAFRGRSNRIQQARILFDFVCSFYCTTTVVFCCLYTNICCLSGYRKLTAMVYTCSWSVPRHPPTQSSAGNRVFPNSTLSIHTMPNSRIGHPRPTKHLNPAHHRLVPPTQLIPPLPHLNPSHSPWKPLTSKRRPAHPNRNVVALVIRPDRLKTPTTDPSVPLPNARIAWIRELTSQDRSPRLLHHP